MTIKASNLIIYSFLLLSFSSWAYESPESFIVRVFDQKVRVLSPVKYDPNLSVLVENKTMIQIKAKVETESGSDIQHISLEAGKSVSVKLNNLNKEKVFFIPLSPPFQKVELKLGSKPYEIPPRS